MASSREAPAARRVSSGCVAAIVESKAKQGLGGQLSDLLPSQHLPVVSLPAVRASLLSSGTAWSRLADWQMGAGGAPASKGSLPRYWTHRSRTA